ncbi:acylphosphatase [Alkalicoccus urumqiensis]|uniref:Acylphosphatase n=1 Tax=Alkalicoccus urumqiensis TaxID=1548213 RepID=A0A2P6MGK9_ALKUR|nr:acylphosphatase [Alkalicoccus urumqiensis]PRO65422.1 acylphosphatase [Alkalicoccus urumqiensis]
MPRYDITVTGRVQGVGFRFFAQTEAAHQDLTGWVRNESDGTVRMEAQGSEEQLHSFIRSIRQARYPAQVDELIPVAVEEKEKESSFRIRHD